MIFFRTTFLVFLFSFFSNISFSQEPTRCGTDEILEQQLLDPKFKRSYQKFEAIAKKVEETKRTSNMSTLPITIPVIVHVIHLGEPYGTDNHLPVEFIQEAFDNLNDNFAGEFSDDPTANTQINFCIANASTDGSPIVGIKYYDWDDLDIDEWGPSSFYNNHIQVSNQIGYDRNNYCNVFIAPFGSPLGFAYIPSSNIGVFVGTNAFGITNIGNYGLNRTLVHEMGHYCGLYHTFHQTSTCTPTNTNCVSQGDKVCDTPVTTGNFGCPTNGGACGNSLVENFMDYTNDACMYSFTQGQTLRMESQLETLRPGVVNNTLACGPINGIDVSINGLSIPNIGCSEIKDITFELQNFGDDVTEVTINYSVNGEDNFIIWTGNLGFAESEIVTIPNIEMGYGVVDIEVNVDALGDVYETNNTSVIQINNYEGTLIDITIEFDDLPFGFSWELFEADTNGNPIGESIDEGGDYTNGVFSCETETNTYCLEEGNYVLVLDDLFGNGMFYPCGGLISIIEGNDTLNTVTGNWGSDEFLPFYVSPYVEECPPLSDCPWDLDGDGIVGTSDLFPLLQNFGLTVECSPLDFNQDSIIGVDDILDFISVFGLQCDNGMVLETEIPESIKQMIISKGIQIPENQNTVESIEYYNIYGAKINLSEITSSGIYIKKIKYTNGNYQIKKEFFN